MGEAASDDGTGVLEGDVDAAAKGLRHWNDGPHEGDGEPGSADQAPSTEHEREAESVEDSYERERRKLKQPVFIDGDDEEGLVAEEHDQDSNGEEEKPPPGSVFGFKLYGTPVAEDEGEADERYRHANAFEGI
jgi:hypothetical protein